MVELAVLERLYAERYRGFESPSLLIHIKRIPNGYPFNMMLEGRGFEAGGPTGPRRALKKFQQKFILRRIQIRRVFATAKTRAFKNSSRNFKKRIPTKECRGFEHALLRPSTNSGLRKGKQACLEGSDPGDSLGSDP